MRRLVLKVVMMRMTKARSTKNVSKNRFLLSFCLLREWAQDILLMSLKFVFSLNYMSRDSCLGV